MSTIINANDFSHEVINSEIPVLVDFFAEWCGPCKIIAPMLDELSVEYEGKIKVVKIDIDEADAYELVTSLGIRSVPTLMLYKEGTAVEKIIGVRPKNELEIKINALI